MNKCWNQVAVKLTASVACNLAHATSLPSGFSSSGETDHYSSYVNLFMGGDCGRSLTNCCRVHSLRERGAFVTRFIICGGKVNSPYVL